uniref:Putative secreted protein n=1 Tax=Xenopsylla cheopis TaxID=163159 RepID=A0A6M2E3A5_XENCH
MANNFISYWCTYLLTVLLLLRMATCHPSIATNLRHNNNNNKQGNRLAVSEDAIYFPDDEILKQRVGNRFRATTENVRNLQIDIVNRILIDTPIRKCENGMFWLNNRCRSII